MSSNWDVVAIGVNQNDLENTKERLKRLKIPESLITSILSNRPVTLKKNLEHAQAYAYKSKLEGYGLLIKLKRHQLATSKAKAVHDTSSKSLGLAPLVSKIASIERPFCCPKCGFEQLRALECKSCGVIFSKLAPQESDNTIDTPLSDLRMNRARAKNIPYQEPKPWLKYASIAIVAFSIFWMKFYVMERPDISIIGDNPQALAATEWAWKNTRYSDPAVDLAAKVRSADYLSLEKDLSKLQQHVINNPVEEYGLWRIFWNLLKDDKAVDENQLKAWVVATDSDWAHVTLGAYYYLKGLDARGNCTSDCISDEQWQAQTTLTRKAVANFNIALERVPSNVVALFFKTSISNDVPGIRINSTETFDKAIAIFPGSYSLREIQMSNLLPRWGGSYSSMDAFALSQQAYVDQNPRLYNLLGCHLQDLAWYARKNKNHASAILLYEQAFTFGARDDWAYDYSRSLNEIAASAPTPNHSTIAMLDRSQDFVEFSIKFSDTKARQQFLKLVKSNIKRSKQRAG